MKITEKYLQVWHFKINDKIYHFSFTKYYSLYEYYEFTFASGYLSNTNDNSVIENKIALAEIEEHHKEKLLEFLMQTPDNTEYDIFLHKLWIVIYEIKGLQ